MSHRRPWNAPPTKYVPPKDRYTGDLREALESIRNALTSVDPNADAFAKFLRAARRLSHSAHDPGAIVTVTGLHRGRRRALDWKEYRADFEAGDMVAYRAIDPEITEVRREATGPIHVDRDAWQEFTAALAQLRRS